MQVSREEILHIAKLADLEIEESKIEKYKENLEEILNFATIVNNAPVEELDITVRTNEKQNVFRKDEVEVLDEENKVLDYLDKVGVTWEVLA